MNTNHWRNALVLGLLTAIGPFAIDMYLPALPSIGKNFGADPDLVLRSLSAFFIPFGVCQLFYGPISDWVGRKPPLYFGIMLFTLASVGCALASDIDMLIGFRFIQGIGAAGAIIVPRAIVRDLHSGVEEARLMSLLMLVFSVSPILAPVAGSILIRLADWRAVFWFVTTAAVLGLIMLIFVVRETRPPESRSARSLTALLGAYRLLFSDLNFLGLTFIGAFALAAFFVYLGNSSFLLIDHYGLSPTLYGVAFSTNAFAFFAAAQLNGWLGKRFGLRRMVRPAVIGFAAAMAIVFLVTLAGVDNLFVMGFFLFLGYGCLGIVLPVTSVLALERHGTIAGTASSLMGCMQLVVGAIVMPLTTAFANGTAMPMIAGIAACATITLLLTQLTLGGRRARLAG